MFQLRVNRFIWKKGNTEEASPDLLIKSCKKLFKMRLGREGMLFFSATLSRIIKHPNATPETLDKITDVLIERCVIGENFWARCGFEYLKNSSKTLDESLEKIRKADVYKHQSSGKDIRIER